MTESGALQAAGGGGFSPYDPLAPREGDSAFRRVFLVSLAIHLLILFFFWDAILGVVLEKKDAIADVTIEEEKPKPQPKLIQQRKLNTAVKKQREIQREIQKLMEVQKLTQVTKTEVDQVQRIEAPKLVQQTDLNVAVTNVFADKVAPVQPIQINTATQSVRAVAPVAPASGGPRVQVSTAPEINPQAVDRGPTLNKGVLSDQVVAGAEDGAKVQSHGGSVSDRLARDGGRALTQQNKNCMNDPKCKKYLEMIRDRVYARWNVPSDVPPGRVQLSFRIDRGGTAHTIRTKRTDDPNLGQTCQQAFRSASPFPPPPPEIQYLVEKGIAATFHYGE